MGDGINHVMTTVQEQQAAKDKSEMCFSSKITMKMEEIKQVIIAPQQQTTKSEDKSELSIGYIGVKLPTTIVPGISLVKTSITLHYKH